MSMGVMKAHLLNFHVDNCALILELWEFEAPSSINGIFVVQFPQQNVPD